VTSDSSDDTSSSDEETSFVVNVPAKSLKHSRRHQTTRKLPIIVNKHRSKSKQRHHRHHRKHIQQFLINAQAPLLQPPPAIVQVLPPPLPPPHPPMAQEIVIEEIIEPPLTREIQYVPVRASTPELTEIIERHPRTYRRLFTPALIEQRPIAYYDNDRSSYRRRIRAESTHGRSIHLPQHARRLVNRFLNRMEYAHDYRVSRPTTRL
jgi:hypothetical protein